MTPYRIVDAFTDRPFAGNPAAVVVTDAPLDGDRAQDIATEFNLSETAFVVRPSQTGGPYGLRWFTPSVEVDLCGHATLAAAHVLFSEERAEEPVRFATRAAGTLSVTREDGLLWMDFPANPPREVPVPDGLAAALGAEPRWAGAAGTGDLVVELASAREVRELRPDWAALVPYADRGVIVTAAEEPGAEHAFVSRFFAPAVDVAEDPVTGSAHTALAPLWGGRLGREAFSAEQVSARGGVLQLRLPADAPDRVAIGGSAVSVGEGRLLY